MSVDPRAEKLASLVLDYSIDLHEGDRLFLQHSPFYSEYAKIFGEQAKAKGAEVRYDSDSWDPIKLRGLVERMEKNEWKDELERRCELARWCNTRILIQAGIDTDYAIGISDKEKRIAQLNKEIIGPYKEVLYRPGPFNGNEVRWNIVGMPTKQDAKAAGMSLEEYTEFVYDATLIPDWRQMEKDMEKIKTAFDKAEDVHLFVPGKTDLHLSLKNRGGCISGGKHNMPGGEVFYGPVEDSVNGTVYFQHPTKRDVGIIRGINLKFEKGRIVEFDAKENLSGLEATLNVDEGVKTIGELGIGFNNGIQRATMSTLFDEKIAGTIHLALGDSFTEHNLSDGGGLNKSMIHWDIVCDLRRDEKDLANFPGGFIKVDGKVVQLEGKWKI
jgi:aminopeptidase